ncbi:hypothetical protein H5410_045894 [Solanum commersonii]|uniref:Uncharacterized protein n=1 Tax=Solanum commersonii TaxID=4109 RepID=A0A9J5XE21_SOLCO|nr:hypothetical protein H5410_045894 [Solanum commersonii]
MKCDSFSSMPQSLKYCTMYDSSSKIATTNEDASSDSSSIMDYPSYFCMMMKKFSINTELNRWLFGEDAEKRTHECCQKSVRSPTSKK